jgi:hypothetical protein
MGMYLFIEKDNERFAINIDDGINDIRIYPDINLLVTLKDEFETKFIVDLECIIFERLNNGKYWILAHDEFDLISELYVQEEYLDRLIMAAKMIQKREARNALVEVEN